MKRIIKHSRRGLAMLLAVLMIIFVGITAFAESLGSVIVHLSGGDQQRHTVGNYQSAYNGYKGSLMDGYAVPMDGSNGNPDLCVPGLSNVDKMVPQGLTYWAEKGWVLISSYEPDDQAPSVIYALEFNTGHLIAQFNLQNVSGGNVYEHVSGIASSANNLYIADAGSKIAYIPLSELDVAVGTVKTVRYAGSVNLNSELNGANTSYASWGDGVLWTGNFYIVDNSSYNTKANNDSGTMMLGYDLNGYASSAAEWAALQALVGNPTYCIPLDAYGINKVQCATVKNGYCYVGTSYGRTNDSQMYIFNVNLSSNIGTITVNNRAKPIIALTNQRNYTHLPMTEGLMVYNGYLWNIFESAAWLYNGKESSVSKNPTDVLWRFDISTLLGIDRELDNESYDGQDLYKAPNVTMGDLSFVVPEVIYLTPDASSYTGSTAPTFQYYVNNNADGSVKAVRNETKGYIYYSYNGASNATLSYQFYNDNLSAAKSGGSISLSSANIASGTTGVTINSGTSPSLSTGESGCYIQWKLSYNDTIDGKAKAAYAYTYVYKPYLSPIFAAGRAKNDRDDDHFCSGLSWVSGIHGISDQGGYYAKNNFIPLLEGPTLGDGEKNPGDWFSDSQQMGLPAKGGWFHDKTNGNNSGDSTLAVFERSAVGYINVDSSRYTNLNTIPNLTCGAYVTDSEGVANGYVYAYVGQLTNGNDKITSGRDWLTGSCTEPSEWNAASTIFAGDRTTNGGQNLIRTANLNIATPASSTEVYIRGGLCVYQKRNDSGWFSHADNDKAFCILDNYLQIMPCDKSDLRTAVQNATKKMAALGVNGAANCKLTSLYFDTNNDYRWIAFQNAYKNAVLGLTRLDSAPETSQLVSALNRTLNDLCTRVTYDANGGTFSGIDTDYVQIGTAQSVNYTPISGNTATRDHYTFSGWSTDANATSATQTITVGYNNTLYAVWIPEQFTITYDANGGIAIADDTVGYGLPLPDRTTTKTGACFDGWVYTGNGSEYKGTTMPAYALTATARWAYPVTDDTYVIDYGLPVLLNVMSNDHSASSLTSVTADNDGYTAVKSGNQILFTPTDILNEAVTFSYTVIYKGDSYVGNVTVVPSNNIYYEDSFVSFANGSGTATWQDVGTARNLTQTTSRTGTSYGYNAAYDTTNESAYSGGQAKYVTVKKGETGATATFEFNGTGFDLYSVTDKQTGVALIDIYKANAEAEGGWENITSTMVNTYFGYKYGRLYLTDDKKITLEATNNDPIYYTSSMGPDAFFVNGTRRGTINPTSEGYAYGWVAGESTTNGIYQVPVISWTTEEYGTYKVVIEPRYSSRQDLTGNGEYRFYVDAVRIYNPVEDQVSYAADHECSASFKEVRDMIISADTYGNTGSAGTAGVAFLETSADGSGIADYEAVGPKNEVYLNPGQAIAFRPTTTGSVRPDKLCVGIKMAQGNSGAVSVYSKDSVGLQITVNGYNDLYRNITTAVEWMQEDGKWTTTAPIVIANTSDTGKVVSITKIKWSYDTAVSGNAKMMQFSFAPNDLMMASAPLRQANQMVIQADSTRPVARWSSNMISKNGVTYLTITAPASFETVIVNGEVVEGYTTTANGNRQWTYQFSSDKTGKYDFDVKMTDANGKEISLSDVGQVEVVSGKNGQRMLTLRQLIQMIFDRFFSAIFKVFKR